MQTDTIETRLQATGRYSSFVDEWARYECAALLTLQRLGFATVQDADGSCFLDEAKRYDVWIPSTILWTIGAIRRGDKVDLVRGALQLAGYCGRIKWPDSQTNDAYIAIRNHLESVVGL